MRVHGRRRNELGAAPAARSEAVAVEITRAGRAALPTVRAEIRRQGGVGPFLDAMPLEEAPRLYDRAREDGAGRDSATRHIIAEFLRRPGGQHEALKRSHYAKLRSLGFTWRDITSPDFRIPTSSRVFRYPETGLEFAHRETSRVARRALARFHAELDTAIEQSTTRDEALEAIAAVHHRWLADPEKTLPRGLR